MNKNLLVCQCANVIVKDVLDIINAYNEIPIDTIKDILNIGHGCGSCQRSNTEVTDISLEKILPQQRSG